MKQWLERHVQTFVGSVDTLFGGFRQRAEDTYAMLQADDTAFVTRRLLTVFCALGPASFAA